RATLDSVDILDVAGYRYILIETVGVGQDEVEIASASHTTLVVSAPGLGDEVQAIKAGILEIRSEERRVGKECRSGWAREFSSRRRHTRSYGDWSSDVCSSDLRATLDSVDILDVAGYRYILIETVGVGQDEVEIASASHTTLVVSAPGLGDEVQAIKAGILEIADVHVVSKSDRPDARSTVSDLKQMLTLGMTPGANMAWRAPVVATSSLKGEGFGELISELARHKA